MTVAPRRSVARQTLFLTLVILLLGVVGLELWTLRNESQVERQRRAIAAMGGKSQTERRVPPWLRTVLGERFHTIFDQTVIVQVNLTGPNIGDEHVARLVDLPHVEVLNLEDSSVTSACLKTVAKLSSLKMLRLVNTQANTLDDLAAMPELQSLALNFSRVRDKQFAALSQLPKLKALGAGGLQVTDDGVAAIAKCIHLEELSLAGAQLGPGGLEPLQSLKMLKVLSLKDARFDPKDLQALQLALPGCKIAA